MVFTLLIYACFLSDEPISAMSKKYFARNPNKVEFVGLLVFGHVSGERFERVVDIADKATNFRKKFVDYLISRSLDKVLQGVVKNYKHLTVFDIEAVMGIRGLMSPNRWNPALPMCIVFKVVIAPGRLLVPIVCNI